MTVPPLPASPCMRAQLDYSQSDGFLGGSRFFISYAGAAPTPGDCTAIATAIAGYWATDIAPIVGDTWGLSEVDVVDIATYTGSSGQWTGNNVGSASGTPLPAQCSTNVEYNIARRYRGGKPRMFLPPGTESEQLDAGHWNTAYLSAVNTGVAAFFTAIKALSQGAVGQLGHVNLSYYQGFKNVTNTSGRTHAYPTYRTTAVVDSVEGYSAKDVIGSQRRRRTATTS